MTSTYTRSSSAPWLIVAILIATFGTGCLANTNIEEPTAIPNPDQVTGEPDTNRYVDPPAAVSSSSAVGNPAACETDADIAIDMRLVEQGKRHVIAVSEVCSIELTSGRSMLQIKGDHPWQVSSPDLKINDFRYSRAGFNDTLEPRDQEFSRSFLIMTGDGAGGFKATMRITGDWSGEIRFKVPENAS